MAENVWQIASTQKRLVTHAQLRALGFTRSAIRHRRRAGRLWLVYPGVYAVGHPDLTQEGEWLAAVLACGDRAALSGLSAACHWRILERPPPRPHHVSVATGNGRVGPAGIALHRPRSLPASDVTIHDGIPITTLARTHVDLAGILDRDQLRAAARQAERVHGYDLAQLRVYADSHSPNSFRHARIRSLLDDHVPATRLTASEREAAFLDLCVRHDIPLPQPQVPIGRYRADFVWPELRLIVEIDDRESHGGYVAFTDDRVRDRALKAAGFEVIRFTVSEVRHHPDIVAADLRAAIARRTAIRSNLG